MKPKVAFFDFTGCEGCQLTVLQLEDKIPALLGAVDIVNFREAMSERGEDYQIAFVEGSLGTVDDIERLRNIRQQAAVLIALGSCASNGGINTLKNFLDLEQAKHMVYGDGAKHLDRAIATTPIDAIVNVDYHIRGCPVNGEEFLEVVSSLLMGKKPNVPEYPVCVQCKLQENMCVFAKDMICMGPITRAGCGALCPTYGNKCEGCRGLVDDPNMNSYKEVLAEYGLTTEDIVSRIRMFDGYAEGSRQ